MDASTSPPTADDTADRVTLVVAIRNEAPHIDRCLRSLTSQDYPADCLEILVVDGESTDGTVAVVRRWADRTTQVRLLENPARLMVPGLNLGIRESSGAYLGVISGHSSVPADYVSRCLALIEKHGAWGVGGGIDRLASSSLQRAIGRAQSHPFGVGGAVHNYGTQGGWAEAVFPGFWPRWVFDRVGDFDDRMLYNEDNELSQRIRAAGGRLWYEPSLRIGYVPRSSLGALWRQYFRYGLGKATLFRAHAGAMRARHLAPAALVVVPAVGLTIGPFVPAISIATAVMALVYVVMALVVAMVSARRGESPLLMASAFIVMHTGYGIGTWAGVLRATRPGSGR